MALKNKYLQWVINRLKEPSTMAGLSCVGVILGLPPGTLEIGTQLIVAAAAAAAVVFPESK